MKKVWVSVLLALFAFCCFGNTAFADGSYDILNYDIFINVSKDNIIDVKETITIDYKVDSHGFYYVLPVRGEVQHKIDGQWCKAGYSNLVYDFQVENKDFELSSEGNNIIAKIGNPNWTVLGKKTYVISYKCKLGDDGIGSFDEFYRNLVFCQEGDSIENASFTIQMPSEFLASSVLVGLIRKEPKEGLFAPQYLPDSMPTIDPELRESMKNYHLNMDGTWEYEERENENENTYGFGLQNRHKYIETPFGMLNDCDMENVHWEKKGNTITGYTLRPISGGECLTLRIELPKGYYQSSGGFVAWESTVFNIIVACVIGGYALWFLFGRDKKQFQTVEFYPPKGMTPAEVGYVFDGCVDDRDVVSMILYWADMGYIEISDKDTSGYKITKLKPIKSDKNYEKILFDSLFEDADTVTLSDLNGQFYNTMQHVKQQLKCYFEFSDERKIFTSLSRFVRGLVCILMVVPITATLVTSIYFSTYNLGISIIAAAGMCALLSIPMTILVRVTMDWRNIGTKKRCRKLIGSFVLLALVAVCYFFVTPNLYNGSLNTGSLVILAAIIIVMMILAGSVFKAKEGMEFRIINKTSALILRFCFIIPAVMGYVIGGNSTLLILSITATIVMLPLIVITPKRTKYGSEMYAKLSGFREYMVKAEKDRIILLAEDSPNLFTDILPYAYVMGVINEWAEKFEGVDIKPPSWFKAYSSETVASSILLGTAIESCMLQMNNHLTSAPKSTGSSGSVSRFGGGSFSGGGGFGGSGGGGIGGRW